jgi:hypothetical protein
MYKDQDRSIGAKVKHSSARVPLFIGEKYSLPLREPHYNNSHKQPHRRQDASLRDNTKNSFQSGDYGDRSYINNQQREENSNSGVRIVSGFKAKDNTTSSFIETANIIDQYKRDEEIIKELREIKLRENILKHELLSRNHPLIGEQQVPITMTRTSKKPMHAYQTSAVKIDSVLNLPTTVMTTDSSPIIKKEPIIRQDFYEHHQQRKRSPQINSEAQTNANDSDFGGMTEPRLEDKYSNLFKHKATVSARTRPPRQPSEITTQTTSQTYRTIPVKPCPNIDTDPISIAVCQSPIKPALKKETGSGLLQKVRNLVASQDFSPVNIDRGYLTGTSKQVASTAAQLPTSIPIPSLLRRISVENGSETTANFGQGAVSIKRIKNMSQHEPIYSLQSKHQFSKSNQAIGRQRSSIEEKGITEASQYSQQAALSKEKIALICQSRLGNQILARKHKISLNIHGHSLSHINPTSDRDHSLPRKLSQGRNCNGSTAKQNPNADILTDQPKYQ